MTDAFSRRSVLKGASALLAGAAAADTFASCAQAEQQKQGSPIRLGVASYTFRNFDRKQLIGMLRQAQVSALNAKDVQDHLPFDPTSEAAAMTAYAAAGITLHAAGAIYFTQQEDQDIRSKFEYCKRANVPVIVAGDPSPQTLARVESYAKQYDMRIAIHNHGPEDRLWQSPLDVLAAISNYDERIGCCIDVGHTMRAGTDVVGAIRRVGPRLFNVHMKDLADSHAKESQVPVGQGSMPVRAIFEALHAIDYQGFVDLESEVHPEDPMPGVLSCLAYMRGVLAGLRYEAG